MDIVIKQTLQRTLPQNVVSQLSELIVGHTLEDMKYEFFCLRELTELYICVIKHIDMCQKIGENKTANNHYEGCCWSRGVFSDPNFFIGSDGCICSTFDANKLYIENRLKDYTMYKNKEE